MRGKYINKSCTKPLSLTPSPPLSLLSHNTWHTVGYPSSGCGVHGQSPQVSRGLHGIRESQTVHSESQRPPSLSPSPPSQCPDQAHEEPGVREGLQVQSRLQGTSGATVHAKRSGGDQLFHKPMILIITRCHQLC